MTLDVTPDTRRVATYERVSSDDQALRQTIKTQTDELARSLARDPSVVLVERYADDGVSGTIPLAERPAGGRLMRDAAAARFDELHVYKFDRLGRDAVDLLVVRRRLIELGIRVISVVEAEPDLLSYDLLSVVADHARREFLRRSADGMARAAREGRYTGGIVAYGYTVLGTKGTARLVPDEREVAPGLSAADAVRLMYTRVADDDWSCERLARELNDLGVLPHYARDARQVRRGERRQRTQGIWRAGRVRNTLANPVYRGELAYGRRTTKSREVIRAEVVPLVEPSLWERAQATLCGHRIGVARGGRTYLLRGVMRCGSCGLTYVGSATPRGSAWYRCNGRSGRRGPLGVLCPGRGFRADLMDALVWRDVERLLIEPEALVVELGPVSPTGPDARRRAELLAQADDVASQQQRAVALHIRGLLAASGLDIELARIAHERAAIEAELDAGGPLGAVTRREMETVIAATRNRLAAGLSDPQKHEIIALLVRGIVRSAASTGAAAVEFTYRLSGPTSPAGTEAAVRRTVRLPLPRRSRRPARLGTQSSGSVIDSPVS